MSQSPPPEAARVPHVRTVHGDSVADHYEWLRDKESAEVIAHLEAENAYTEQRTAHLAPLRERVFEEIRSRTQETDMSVPVRRGPWWYFTRSVEGRQYALHCRIPVSADDDWDPPEPSGSDTLPGEQVILDGNAEAEGHEFFSLGGFDLSDDGTLLAYAVDTSGDERYLLRVRDLATGEDRPDSIPDTAPGATFDPSGRNLFYPTVDDAWRTDRIWRHRLGTPREDDVVVLHEPDERFWTGVGRSRSGAFLEFHTASKVTSEVRLLPADAPEGRPVVVWPRSDGVEYDVEHAVIDGRSRLLITHNRDSVDFDIVDVPADRPAERTLERIVFASDESTRVEGVDAFADHLVFSYRRDGLTRVAVQSLEPDAPRQEIDFGEPLLTVETAGNPEWSQPRVRLVHTSLVAPATVVDVDVATGERTVLKRQPVLGGYDPADYVQWRAWARADDGALVPLSLVRKAGAPSGPSPTILYGYGSYEISVDPTFSIARLSLLDRGVTFAIAHVRGGGELGRSWYERGRRLDKRNTFTDFVACARHLVEEEVTAPDRLVIEGGSAGGLLVGAAVNLAPDLFAGVLAQVPFVDALTSVLDPDLPLTVIEWDEWGDPLHDPEVYRYIRSYTPYENVRDDAAYPRILAMTSLNDTRVLYVEPAKWVARLREVGAPVLLRTEMNAGHGGVSGRYERWKEIAFEYAWMLDVLGLSEVPDE